MITLIAAIATVLGTLAGVFLGSYLQRRARKDEWLRQDSLRWLEERREQYSSFIEAMDTANSYFNNIYDRDSASRISEYMPSLRHRLATVKLISSSNGVVRTASEFVDLFEDTAVVWKDMQPLAAAKPDNDPAKQESLKAYALKVTAAWANGVGTLTRVAESFTFEARAELGLSELNQHPIKHSAESTREYAELKSNEQLDYVMKAFKKQK